MKRSLLLTLFCILSGSAIPARSPLQTFDKAGYYSALASGKQGEITAELSAVKASSIREKEAYEGALLMRMAGLLTRPKEKLNSFKLGAVQLENALSTDSGNAEYHFLRLMIQEHAPKIVHYNKDQEKDSQMITKSFPTLSSELKKAILNYCPHSKLLHERELNKES